MKCSKIMHISCDKYCRIYYFVCCVFTYILLKYQKNLKSELGENLKRFLCIYPDIYFPCTPKNIFNVNLLFYGKTECY